MDNPFNEIELRLNNIENLLQYLLNNYPKNNSEPNDEFLTVKQTAELLDLAVQTIYGLVNRREIPNIKKGRRLYFIKSDINNWLSQGRRKTQTEMLENAQDNIK